MSNKQRDAGGEDLAVQALEAHGYRITDRNWHCEAGEIDIIARDADTWVFVKVKLRQGDGFGTSEEAVAQTEQARLLKSAQLFLAEQNLLDVDWRIDLVAITLAPDDLVHQLEIYENAVTADVE